jgi:hypothetical protein
LRYTVNSRQRRIGQRRLARKPRFYKRPESHGAVFAAQRACRPLVCRENEKSSTPAPSTVPRR